MDIYIHRNGDNLGPFTQEQIKERLARNEFSATDHAWHEGLEGWTPLEDLLRAVQEPSPQSDASVPQSSGLDNHRERATIYIIRGDIELGPYTVDDINTHLKTDVFRTSDVAKHSGSEKLMPLIAVPGVRHPKSGGATTETVDNLLPSPPAAHSRIAHPLPKRATSALIAFIILVLFVLLGAFYLGYRRKALPVTTDAAVDATPPAPQVSILPNNNHLSPTKETPFARPSEAQSTPESSKEADGSDVRRSHLPIGTGDHAPLMEALISICDICGVTDDHRDGSPSITRDQHSGWSITIPIKNIRDDHKQADTLGMMAVLIAHQFSLLVSHVGVQSTFVAIHPGAPPTILAQSDSSKFQPKRKAWIINANAFASMHLHGWLVGTIDTTGQEPKDVAPFATDNPLLQVFAFEQSNNGSPAMQWDSDHPLLTVNTVSKIGANRDAVTVTLNEKDMISFATLTRRYTQEYLFLRAGDGVGEAMHITGEITDGRLSFSRAVEPELCKYLQARFRPGDLKRD